MNRKQRVTEIQDRLERRKLVWFGTRGADARALLEIAQFSDSFSLIAPLEGVPGVSEVCLETLKMQRVDLDTYSLDHDNSEQTREFHRRLFACLEKPSTVITYRAGSFFTSIYLTRIEFVHYLGLFHERQAPFEHKPWVETELRKLGVKVVPWRYFGVQNLQQLVESVKEGPLVLRPIRSDGGAGVKLIRESEEMKDCLPSSPDGLVAAAPYMHPNIPINVNACVYSDGFVALHAPSIQLVGLPGYTTRPFGYCGNDFTAIRDLDPYFLKEFEAMTRLVGTWLARMGYVGAFGIDAIAYEGDVYLTEVNPRFQGSSAVSAEIDRQLDRPHVFLDHIAAFLGLPPPSPMSLVEFTRQQPRVSQVVAHNVSSHPVVRNAEPTEGPDSLRYELLPAPGVAVEPEGTLFRAVISEGVTKDGHTIVAKLDKQLRRVITGIFEPVLEHVRA